MAITERELGDLRGLPGQVQEDDRLDRFGGGQGRVVGMLHEAAQYAHGQDAWSGRLVILYRGSAVEVHQGDRN